MNKRPNILMVLVDQHIADVIGCAGHPQAITPNIDRLAAKGMRFTNAYAASPICLPSRVSIASGQYVHNHGYYGLNGPQPGHHGSNMLPSVFGHFKNHGYRTAGIGKLHMPNQSRNWLEHDLDWFADCYQDRDGSKNSKYISHLRRHGLLEMEDSIALREFPGRQQHEGRPSNLPYEHSAEGWCASEAMAFIDSGDADVPFFAQVSLPRPHQCYAPDKKFWDMYPADLALPETYEDDAGQRAPHFQRMARDYRANPEQKGLLEPRGLDNVSRRVWRAYLACITQCDFALGQMMDHLQQRGLADNTIVIYAADHGAYTTSFGIPEKAPGICSEFVCRIPMIWHAPGITPAGSISEHLTHHVDLAPTCCALAGIDSMPTVDGADITALLRGENAPVREEAVTENVWSKSIRWDNWRLVHYAKAMFNQDAGELYDIKADRHERRNLYHDAAHQHVVHEGRRRLLEWLIETARVKSTHPPAGKDGSPQAYAVAGDGCISNQHRIVDRVSQHGPSCYI